MTVRRGRCPTVLSTSHDTRHLATLDVMDPLRVIVQPGTGYDLLLSAVAIADRSSVARLDRARELRARASRIDGGDLSRAIERIGREPFISLMGFVHAMTEEPSAPAAIAAIETAEPRELVLAALGYYRRAMRDATQPAVIRAAVDGSEDAAEEFRRTSFPELRYWQTSLRFLLGTDHREARDFVGATLRRWYEAGFSELEPDIEEAHERDATAVRQLLTTTGLDAVLERIVPNLTFAREIGQSLVVLTPSALVGPSFALTDYGSTLVIAYPAAREGRSPDQPPDRLVRYGKAIGDELRLRALRELRSGSMTGSELARRLGVPRTSLQHHLGLLVSSGLVTLSVDDARWGTLELREEALGDVGRLFESWLLEAPDRAPSAATPVRTSRRRRQPPP
jgi:DNA-binding transcriptional ArsR family regulator